MQFYTTVDSLYQNLFDFFAPSFAKHEGMVVVARPGTREGLVARLKTAGLPVEEALANGQLLLLDAQTVLDSFVKDGMPDGEMFDASVGSVMRTHAKKFPFARAYGEMVDILWHEKNTAGSLRLERFWHRLAENLDFALFCGYAIGEHKMAEQGASVFGVCCSHTHLVSDDGKLRTVTAV